MFMFHEFRRADMGKKVGEGGEEGDVVVEEWTDPADGFKEVFFRNVISVFSDANSKIGPSDGLQLLTTIAWVDNYPEIQFLPQWMGYYVSHGLREYVGWVVGV
jgi:hypothetical protein